METGILADDVVYGHHTALLCDLPDLTNELHRDIYLEEIFSEFPSDVAHLHHEEEILGEDHAHSDAGIVSKSVVSERNRRMRLKERLLSLRAVVPNITKMDKASIISDAITYIRELQSQTERVQAEIVSLQSGIHKHSSAPFPRIKSLPDQNGGLETQCFEISQLDITKVEDQIFLIRIACKKKAGLIPRLARALESLIGEEEMISTNASAFDASVVVTTTAEVKKWETKQADEIKEIFLEAASIYGLKRITESKVK